MFSKSVKQELTVRKLATEHNYFKILEVNNAFRISCGSRYNVTKFHVRFYDNTNLKKHVSDLLELYSHC